jgi:hypothetical protein
MLPYSAAIDYAAYQSRASLQSSDGISMPATGYSWLVPSQDLCVASFKSNHPPTQQIMDPGQVFFRGDKKVVEKIKVLSSRHFLRLNAANQP